MTLIPLPFAMATAAFVGFSILTPGSSGGLERPHPSHQKGPFRRSTHSCIPQAPRATLAPGGCACPPLPARLGGFSTHSFDLCSNPWCLSAPRS